MEQPSNPCTPPSVQCTQLSCPGLSLPFVASKPLPAQAASCTDSPSRSAEWFPTPPPPSPSKSFWFPILHAAATGPHPYSHAVINSLLLSDSGATSTGTERLGLLLSYPGTRGAFTSQRLSRSSAANAMCETPEKPYKSPLRKEIVLQHIRQR